jgi:hypothetical protein
MESVVKEEANFQTNIHGWMREIEQVRRREEEKRASREEKDKKRG